MIYYVFNSESKAKDAEDYDFEIYKSANGYDEYSTDWFQGA